MVSIQQSHLRFNAQLRLVDTQQVNAMMLTYYQICTPHVCVPYHQFSLELKCPCFDDHVMSSNLFVIHINAFQNYLVSIRNYSQKILNLHLPLSLGSNSNLLTSKFDNSLMNCLCHTVYSTTKHHQHSLDKMVKLSLFGWCGHLC